MLTSELTADEISEAEAIIEKLGVLIMNIEAAIQVLLAEVSHPTEQCVCLPCCPLPSNFTGTSTMSTGSSGSTGTGTSTSSSTTAGTAVVGRGVGPIMHEDMHIS